MVLDEGEWSVSLPGLSSHRQRALSLKRDVFTLIYKVVGSNFIKGTPIFTATNYQTYHHNSTQSEDRPWNIRDRMSKTQGWVQKWHVSVALSEHFFVWANVPQCQSCVWSCKKTVSCRMKTNTLHPSVRLKPFYVTNTVSHSWITAT